MPLTLCPTLDYAQTTHSQQKPTIGTYESFRAKFRPRWNFDNCKPDIGPISKKRAEKASSWTPVTPQTPKWKYNMQRDIHTYSRNFSFIGPITGSQELKIKRNLLWVLLRPHIGDRAENESRNQNNSKTSCSSFNYIFDEYTRYRANFGPNSKKWGFERF